MSEKRKWFDRKFSPLPVPHPIVIAAELREEDLAYFLEEISPTRNRRVRYETYKLFTGLAGMSAAIRLARNLKVLLGFLASREVNSITSDGVTEEERAALVNLELVSSSQFSREVAQLLLNVPERYQLLQSLGGMFRQARNVKG